MCAAKSLSALISAIFETQLDRLANVRQRFLARAPLAYTARYNRTLSDQIAIVACRQDDW